MAQATISVRMDAELKKDFDKICDDLGMTMTTAVTMLAKKMVREKRIPFEPYLDPFYVDRDVSDVLEKGSGPNNRKNARMTLEKLEKMFDGRSVF